MNLAEQIADLFDEEFGYSIHLTRLVDGESTYTLTVEGEFVGEFPGYDEASGKLGEVKRAHRAALALKVIALANGASLVAATDQTLDDQSIDSRSDTLSVGLDAGGSGADLAQRFHETYERLAPSFGYETREASAKPWADVPEQNKALMIAVCTEILGGVK